jgi:hypothetical protein
VVVYAAGGVMWFVYPKAGQLGADLNRDKVWRILEPLGMRPTTRIALDAVWSALCFRLLAEVGRWWG